MRHESLRCSDSVAIASSVLLFRQVYRDRFVAQQFPQFSVQQVVHEVSIAMVKPDAVVEVVVVAFRAAARTDRREQASASLCDRAKRSEDSYSSCKSARVTEKTS